MNSRFRINVISIVTLAILWEIAGRTLDSVLIPPLSHIGSAWLRLLLSGKLLSNLVMSLGTLAAGFFLASNPANSFFSLITAVHGLHMLGGLVALARTAGKMWRGLSVEKLRLSVELCAIYWHFLLVVWLLLFALLLHT